MNRIDAGGDEHFPQGQKACSVFVVIADIAKENIE